MPTEMPCVEDAVQAMIPSDVAAAYNCPASSYRISGNDQHGAPEWISYLLEIYGVDRQVDGVLELTAGEFAFTELWVRGVAPLHFSGTQNVCTVSHRCCHTSGQASNYHA